MKLYNFPWGPFPRRVAIFLAEKGITDLAQVEVEFPHRPERWPPGFLRSINPAASLPALALEDGTTIGQSLAILEYLEERYPEPNLLGTTASERAATRALTAVFDEATTYFGIWARQGSRLNAERHMISVDAAAVGAERFTSRLRIAEAMASDGPFLTGTRVTIADCVAMALLEFVQDFYGVSIPDSCPKIRAWYQRFRERRVAPPCSYPPDMLAVSFGLQAPAAQPGARPA